MNINLAHDKRQLVSSPLKPAWSLVETGFTVKSFGMPKRDKYRSQKFKIPSLKISLIKN
jgi:hypothetical protein